MANVGSFAELCEALSEHGSVVVKKEAAVQGADGSKR